MGDLITLICPSCGGKLHVSQNTTVLNCQHCGTEHLVRREAGNVSLEAFAQCPRCRRNDRVEKVSSIVKSQTQEYSITERKTEIFTDEQGRQKKRTFLVPVNHTQISSLAQQLIPPKQPASHYDLIEYEPKPIHQNFKLMVALIFLTIGGMLLFGTLCAISYIGFLQTVFQVWFIFIITIGLLSSGIYLMIVSNKQNQKEKNEISQWNQHVLNNWRIRNSQETNHWNIAMGNWNQLYYCHRDDCVFIPNKGTYAPVEKMLDYIYY